MHQSSLSELFITGNTLFSSGVDNLVKAWNINDPSNPVFISNLTSSPHTNGHIALSIDGTTLFSTGLDDLIEAWDISDPSNPSFITNLDFLNAHTADVYKLSISENILFSGGSGDGNINIGDINTVNNPIFLESLPFSTNTFDCVNALAISGNTLFAGGKGNRLSVWQ